MWSVTRICQIAKITHRYTSTSADSSGLSESLDRLRLCYGAAQTAWGCPAELWSLPLLLCALALNRPRLRLSNPGCHASSAPSSAAALSCLALLPLPLRPAVLASLHRNPRARPLLTRLC